MRSSRRCRSRRATRRGSRRGSSTSSCAETPARPCRGACASEQRLRRLRGSRRLLQGVAERERRCQTLPTQTCAPGQPSSSRCSLALSLACSLTAGARSTSGRDPCGGDEAAQPAAARQYLRDGPLAGRGARGALRGRAGRIRPFARLPDCGSVHLRPTSEHFPLPCSHIAEPHASPHCGTAAPQTQRRGGARGSAQRDGSAQLVACGGSPSPASSRLAVAG